MRRPVHTVSTVEFAEWTPEVISITTVVPGSESELRKLIDDQVHAAVAAERAAMQEREAELLAREAEIREREVAAAYERGRAEGRELGESGEAARLRTAVQAAEEALDVLREGEVRWTGTIEENVCALAVIIARQVIGREMKEDVDAVASLVKIALSEFPIDQPIRIRVNPGDLNALGSIGAVENDPFAAISGDREARWLPDASIAPGGCVVEGRERIIDGRVDTALERVYRRLTYTNA